MPDKGGATISPKRRRLIADRTEGYIIKHLPDFIRKLEELAMGIMIEKTDGRSGETHIYMRAPDRQALEFLIEHGLGKVPQRQELTGEGGGPIDIIPWLPAAPNVPQLEDGSTDADSRSSAQPEEEAEEAEEVEEGVIAKS
ncbi:hypothetical protein LCGC14_0734950 [marine sediment metagenome]|uniref:Uncharacterized protein n=1 Tax=marine sediment metagenome TaxID=412755 RepID=A0A0F9Q8K7_9ZZZZ